MKLIVRKSNSKFGSTTIFLNDKNNKGNLVIEIPAPIPGTKDQSTSNCKLQKQCITNKVSTKQCLKKPEVRIKQGKLDKIQSIVNTYPWSLQNTGFNLNKVRFNGNARRVKHRLITIFAGS